MINIDLHIHSYISKYKESINIVDDSTVENIEILLEKLNEHKINLFSITDHNRFDINLYKRIDSILQINPPKFKNIQNILAGVEFDVKIDPDLDKCHILTYFDANNKPTNYQKICDILDKNKLTSPSDFYTKQEFENILIEINLDGILIACQYKDINNHDGNRNSASDSSKDVKEILYVGYFDALEYQSTKVQGILMNNLKEFPRRIGLVTGSDCHSWNFYPKHDENSSTPNDYYSKVRMLPTFKGLQLAISSPETRFDCRDNMNKYFFKGISIHDSKIPLVNGINAIIGENGAGKSTLLNIICENIGPQYVKEIQRKNNVKRINEVDCTKIKYIEQGYITEKFNKKSLFKSSEDEIYALIDNTPFEESYNTFSSGLKNLIEQNILQKNKIDALINSEIEYFDNSKLINHFINIICPDSFAEIINTHTEPRDNLSKLLRLFKEIYKKPYFLEYVDEFEKMLTTFERILKEIEKKWILSEAESQVRNIIYGKITNYNLKTHDSSTSKEKEKIQNNQKRQQTIDSILAAVKSQSKTNIKVNIPKVFDGLSQKKMRGFFFNRKANYHQQEMLQKFYEYMFTQQYQDIESLILINTKESHVRAIRNCTNTEDINKIWKINYIKFNVHNFSPALTKSQQFDPLL